MPRGISQRTPQHCGLIGPVAAIRQAEASTLRRFGFIEAVVSCACVVPRNPACTLASPATAYQELRMTPNIVKGFALTVYIVSLYQVKMYTFAP